MVVELEIVNDGRGELEISEKVQEREYFGFEDIIEMRGTHGGSILYYECVLSLTHSCVDLISYECEKKYTCNMVYFSVPTR